MVGTRSEIGLADAERGQFVAEVVANVPLCREHFRLVLRLTSFPATEPGQFVQLSCRDLDQNFSPEREFEWEPGRPIGIEGTELMAPLAFLRRPFSLAGRRDTAAGVELDLIHRVVGVGTDWMSRLNIGDTVHLLGPLGNRFRLTSPGETAVLVGGGVGIPPMLYLAEKLAGKSAVAFCGALTHDLLPFTLVPGQAGGVDQADARPQVEEFARHGVPSVITTDDGSYGFRGFVTQALEQWLDHVRDRSTTPVIYTCGPEPMMKRVADIAAVRGLVCQVAVERAMACGMGTCQSCCIKLRTPETPEGWRYRLACTDGPVFLGSDLLW